MIATLSLALFLTVTTLNESTAVVSERSENEATRNFRKFDLMQREREQLEKNETATTKVWYGWQSLVTDAALLGVTAAFTSNESQADAAITAYVVGYLFGVPLVHVMNEHYWPIGVSIAMRWILPLVGGAIGSRQCTGLCSFGTTLVGLGVGAGVAILADALILGWKDVESQSQNDSLTISLAPWRKREEQGGNTSTGINLAFGF